MVHSGKLLLSSANRIGKHLERELFLLPAIVHVAYATLILMACF